MSFFSSLGIEQFSKEDSRKVLKGAYWVKVEIEYKESL